MGVLTLLLPFASLLFVACSEEDDTQEEYPNWQETNDAYFSRLVWEVQQGFSSLPQQWVLYPCFTMPEEYYTFSYSDYVVAERLEQGYGTTSPLQTDSVEVHFEQTWLNEYNPKTMTPSKMGVSQTVKAVTQNGQTTYQTSSNIDGFTTALMQMHEGDRWMVYIPYSLAYGTEATDNIPAYSTLVFDLTLAAFYHTGQVVPRF